MTTAPATRSTSDAKAIAAARMLMRVQAGYAAKGIALSQAALCGAHGFVEWAHYPARDCTDLSTGFEFYYHAHTRDEMSADEHGHFHLFQRNPRDNNKFLHLVGISLDGKGLPIRLFTTNAWVTGEALQSAVQVAKAVGRFSVSAQGRVAPIARWVSAMAQLYAPEIAQLARQRDAKLAHLASRGRPMKDILQDRRLRVLSQRRINLFSKLNQHCPT